MWTTMPCLPRIKPGIPWGNGLPGEGQFLGEWPDQGVRPHKEGFLVYRNGPIMEMVYREKGGPGKNGSWVAWRFRESGPPSTRKGYAAAVSGKAANGGRRAAAPTALSPDRMPVGAAPLGGPSPPGGPSLDRPLFFRFSQKVIPFAAKLCRPEINPGLTVRAKTLIIR